ncbi:MAG: tetratricopeptide repeat protein, partial [Phenylobacterium sp.]
AYRFLAMAQAGSGDPASAVRSLRRAIALAPDRADLWEALGETRMAQADGAVDAAAQAAFREALRRDPTAAWSRFRLGQARIEAGDQAAGLASWKALLADLPQDDPRRTDLAQAIASVETPPTGMIRGMVEGLAARLEQQPDDPEGWVRLVRSYAVLGDAAARDRALASAKARFAGRAEVIQALDEAARAEAMR